MGAQLNWVSRGELSDVRAHYAAAQRGPEDPASSHARIASSRAARIDAGLAAQVVARRAAGRRYAPVAQRRP